MIPDKQLLAIVQIAIENGPIAPLHSLTQVMATGMFVPRHSSKPLVHPRRVMILFRELSSRLYAVRRTRPRPPRIGTINTATNEQIKQCTYCAFCPSRVRNVNYLIFNSLVHWIIDYPAILGPRQRPFHVPVREPILKPQNIIQKNEPFYKVR